MPDKFYVVKYVYITAVDFFVGFRWLVLEVLYTGSYDRSGKNKETWISETLLWTKDSEGLIKWYFVTGWVIFKKTVKKFSKSTA